MNNWIIVGIPLLVKAIILNILEVHLEDLGVHKRELIILQDNIFASSFALYAVIHHPIRLPTLAFHLPLDLMTVPQSLCHLLTPHVILY